MNSSKYTLYKITFDHKIDNMLHKLLYSRLSNNKDYTFINTHTNESFTMKFYDYSRIDGCPYFKLNNNITTKLPIENYSLSYSNPHDLSFHLINIDKSEIITPIPDPTKYFTYRNDNEKEIINFILNQCDMTYEDLDKQDAYKTVIRQLKLNNIIKD